MTLRLATLLVVLLLAPAIALAQSERDWKLCAADDADAAIPACTRLINSGGLSRTDRAIAYYNRGLTYRAKGDLDRAIVDWTTAIALDPKLAIAYNNRGLAYHDKGDLDRAIADYDKTIALDPKLAIAYNNRGLTYRAKGDLDRAIADYTRAVELDAAFARDLGIAHYDKGDFKAASAALQRALELKDDIYAMLFRFLSRTRAGETVAAADLDANAERLKTREWPYAVIELYLDRRSPKLVLDAAAKPDEKCEAHFYIGQWRVVHGRPAEARAPLQTAADTCPKNFIEHATALNELKRLPQ
jgi:lipoprotein NlpI